MIKKLFLLFIAQLILLKLNVKSQELTSFVLSDSIFNEKSNLYFLKPEVRVLINKPNSEKLDKNKSSILVLYLLPNGNSIEWTIGKQINEGDDWHYNIQHIGAQTRRLRELIPEKNIIVAYLENKDKSWPLWRRVNPNSNYLITALIDSIRLILKEYGDKITLAGHSGGGSFIFGLINAYNQVPSFINRICLLDANYNYNDSLGHTDKLFNWLLSDSQNTISVFAYDDREIVLNGKKIIGSTGGTFRRSFEMVEKFKNKTTINHFEDSIFHYFSGMNNQVYFAIHKNPRNEILHTVLVEKNGFINSITLNSLYKDRGEKLWEEKKYGKWILK
jgi:hypothetical protein